MNINTWPVNLRPRAARFLKNASLGLFLLEAMGPKLTAQVDYATPYAFTLFAGGGIVGSTDGTGTAARFYQPYGLALDGNGNLFVADKDNHVIREITPGGAVTTLAGLAGTSGTTDAVGSDARFDQPTGIAVGSGGDLYIADSINNTIRKSTAQGSVTTFAGTPGTGGSLDGTAGAALFRQPIGVAIDSSGNAYVSDFGNNSIRKITPAGVVMTLAGTPGVAGITGSSTQDGLAGAPGHADGTGTAASFNQPTGIAVDGNGNVYVADTANSTIRMVTSAGAVTTLAGTAGAVGSSDGTGAAARFDEPRGVAVDGNGNVFVADNGNATIRKITPAGVVTTLAGTPGDFIVANGTGPAAMFDDPVGIVVDGSNNLYVAEELGNVISKGAASTATTPPPATTPVFTTQPISVTVAGGSVALDAVAGNAASYQWMLNGGVVPGATDSTLVLGNAAAGAGSYTCVATNASGSVTSSAATVSLSATTDVGHLANISCRSQVGTGANILIAGFAVGGAGPLGSESLLVRASGPALAAFQVAGFLPDPELQLFSGSSSIASNSGWGGSAAISAAASSVGAFSWNVPTSHDSALAQTLGTGAYSAQVSGEAGDTGVALVEVYDATQGAFSPLLPRIINISARTQVGTGANVLIAGFVIGGSTSKTVLIRASGPAIAGAPFSVAGALPDPELKLYAGNTLLETNDSWGGDAEIAAAAASVGAFSWTAPTSKDSAILVTLPPGSYTAQVSGASGDTGIALVEVYDVQ
jgi:sugar lactone lactonase YvrE